MPAEIRIRGIETLNMAAAVALFFMLAIASANDDKTTIAFGSCNKHVSHCFALPWKLTEPSERADSSAAAMG